MTSFRQGISLRSENTAPSKCASDVSRRYIGQPFRLLRRKFAEVQLLKESAREIDRRHRFTVVANYEWTLLSDIRCGLRGIRRRDRENRDASGLWEVAAARSQISIARIASTQMAPRSDCNDW
jgi:hypothetical protein